MLESATKCNKVVQQERGNKEFDAVEAQQVQQDKSRKNGFCCTSQKRKSVGVVYDFKTFCNNCNNCNNKNKKYIGT